jgi:hypothetical protein
MLLAVELGLVGFSFFWGNTVFVLVVVVAIVNLSLSPVDDRWLTAVPLATTSIRTRRVAITGVSFPLFLFLCLPLNVVFFGFVLRDLAFFLFVVSNAASFISVPFRPVIALILVSFTVVNIVHVST